MPLTNLAWAVYAAGIALMLTSLFVKGDRHGRRTATVGVLLIVTAIIIGGWWPWWPVRGW